MAKDRKNKKHVTMSKKELIGKVQLSNLQSTLKRIYCDEISLNTTMTCKCVCCKVAMPQMNYSEFIQIVTTIWNEWNVEDKTRLILSSLEYYFKNDFEKWGIETLVKPCMLQGNDGLCKIYENRSLSCRMFGIWPVEEYEKRVDRFEKAYAQYGLTREDLPLYHQCPLVKRTDTSKDLTIEIVNGLYSKLDKLDKRIGEFSDLEIKQKHNYRTFHDFLMLKIFGEEWLSMLTTFMMAATKEQLVEQLEVLKDTVRASFSALNDKMLTTLDKQL